MPVHGHGSIPWERFLIPVQGVVTKGSGGLRDRDNPVLCHPLIVLCHLLLSSVTHPLSVLCHLYHPVPPFR